MSMLAPVVQPVPIRAKRRFTDRKKTGKPIVLKDGHAALVNSTTIFLSRVKEPGARLLKSGQHSRKIGSHVTKGKWAGMPIFTLTLEERKTCPTYCTLLKECYGNHMHFAIRHKHGDDLEAKLQLELSALQANHPKGFVLRLHVLGDFYSPKYIMKWARWMALFPAMRVFGYTALDPQHDPAGIALKALHDIEPERWWVRWSFRDKTEWLSTGESGIVCPAQTGKTSCCGTCALCWTVKKPIKFLVH